MKTESLIKASHSAWFVGSDLNAALKRCTDPAERAVIEQLVVDAKALKEKIEKLAFNE